MNGSMIPLAEHPSGVYLQRAIAAAFVSFGQVEPTFAMKEVATGALTMLVSGSNEDSWCWVQVVKWPEDPRDELAREFMCYIDSRGNKLFCALVAYGVCAAYDSILIDEGGFLAAGENLDSEWMKRLIAAQLEN